MATYDIHDTSQRAAAERLNLMVVGESGLGKTTCIQTLLNALDKDKITPLRWKSKKTLDITEVAARYICEDGLLPSYCHISDSPGYGDDVNNQHSFDIIRDDLMARHKEYDEVLRTLGNRLDPSELKQKDRRIHCCLYFIAPHRMKKIDVEFIEYLCEYVVVVPVIAKADTMTSRERGDCLDEVKRAILAIEQKLKQSMEERAVPPRERIRATFNFNDREELYAPSGPLRATLHQGMHPLGDEGGEESEEEGDEREELLIVHEFGGGGNSDDEEEEEEGGVKRVQRTAAEDAPAMSAHHQGAAATDSATDSATDLTEEEKEGSGRCGWADAADEDSMDYPVIDDSSGSLVFPIKRYRNVFAVVADPTLWRRYEWGPCSVEDPLHSDFPVLKRLLFQPRTILGMINETRKRTAMLLEREQLLEREWGSEAREAARAKEVTVEEAAEKEETAVTGASRKAAHVLAVGCGLLALGAAVLYLFVDVMRGDGVFQRTVMQGTLPVWLSPEDLAGYQSRLEEQQRRAALMEDKYLKLTAQVAVEHDSKCFHIDSIINYNRADYTYQDLLMGAADECVVSSGPLSKGVVISTSCPDKTVRVKNTHLMATAEGLQLASSLNPGDVLFGDYDRQQLCEVDSVKEETTPQQYFLLNCVHSEVLASGIRTYTVPSPWLERPMS